METKLAAAFTYLVVVTVWIYGVLDRDPQVALWLALLSLAFVAAAHIAAGLIIGLPALVLTLALLLVAIPAGKSDPDSDVPLWLLNTIWLPVWLLLVAIGIFWRERAGGGSRRDPAVDADLQATR